MPGQITAARARWRVAVSYLCDGRADGVSHFS
jgi:hypothetical protein